MSKMVRLCFKSVPLKLTVSKWIMGNLFKLVTLEALLFCCHLAKTFLVLSLELFLDLGMNHLSHLYFFFFHGKVLYWFWMIFDLILNIPFRIFKSVLQVLEIGLYNGTLIGIRIKLTFTTLERIVLTLMFSSVY